MRGGNGRRRGDAGHDSEERWLLTYSDMITLLMALFMVLFSISSVNVSKYRVLQESLKSAFSGSVLPSGRSILQTGSTSNAGHSAASTAIPSMVPLTPSIPRAVDQVVSNVTTAVGRTVVSATAATREQSELTRLKAQLDTYAAAHGIADQVRTTVARRGLVVRVLTDRVLFDSGQANLKPAGLPLLSELARLLNVDTRHPIMVEGHTDNEPIASAEFPSNWELSTARATTVVRYLIAQGVNRNRLAAAGYADLHPVASNGTVAGRQLNRRVEVVLERLNPPPGS